MTEPANARTTEPLLLHLVGSLSAAALQQLGKLVNPATGKAETNLEGARYSIDLIEAIERKTRGNLSDEERRMIGESLTMLRLNYVETSAAAATPPAAAAKPAPDTPAPDAPAADAAPAAEPPANGGKAGDPPRFHKSYG